MSRVPSLLQRVWPTPEGFREMALDWGRRVSEQILRSVWQGCDEFSRDVIDQVGGIQGGDSHIERGITQLLVPKIRHAMNGFGSFDIEHEVYEFETAKSPQAQPPQYDFGFIHSTNPGLIWPVEAKFLRSDRNVGDYVKEITENFLECRYAPFVDQAAMLGYLLSGSPVKAFGNIAKKVPCELREHPQFSDRNHKTSDHIRNVPEGKPYPSHFRCHHLILEVGSKKSL